MSNTNLWLNKVKWDEHGLVPVIAQDANSADVLMFAFMNRQALQETLATGQAVYWSRSRKRLWHKGETSGHFQKVREVRLDCDEDAVLLKVEQVLGIACHTGRHSCFFQELRSMPDGTRQWVSVDPVIEEPKRIEP